MWQLDSAWPKHAVDNSRSENIASFFRCWPLGLYFGGCLLLAANQQYVLLYMEAVATMISLEQQIFSGSQFGQAMGVSCVLALIAGLCGRNIIRSLGIASLLAVLLFLTLIYFGMRGNHGLSELLYAYNLPLMVFGAAIPLWIARTITRTFLSRQGFCISPNRFRIEHLLQFTTVVACLLLYYRVPMQVNKLTISQVLVYLPGLVLISAQAATFTVLPSIRWAFQEKVTWRSWLLVAITASLGISVLCATFSLLLGRWMPGAVFRVAGTLTTLAFFLPIYLAGVFALRASGFRWVQSKASSVTSTATIPGSPPQSVFNTRTGWYWMAGFLLFAITSAVPIYWIKQQERLTLQTVIQARSEIRADGGAAGISSDRIFKLRLPAKRFDFWMENLRKYRPYEVSLAGLDIGDAEVEKLIGNHPTVGMLNLSDTLITDRAVEVLEKAENLMSLNLSRTKVTAEAIAKLISNSRSRLTALTLEDMQFTDEDFERFYSPHIHCWSVQGNRLTEKSILPIFQNGALYLDFSRNPGSARVFLNPQLQSNPSSIKLNDSSIGDAEIATWLATVPVPPSEVIIGKTSMTLKGLGSLLGFCNSITLLDGSFDEQSLSQLRPLTVPSRLTFSGKSFTGEFLVQWKAVPYWLNAANSSFSDTQLAKLAGLGNAKINAIILQNCSITDSSIPWLEKLQPRHIVLSNTQVTADALLRSSLNDALITVEPEQFTYEELEKLREKCRLEIVSGFESGD